MIASPSNIAPALALLSGTVIAIAVIAAIALVGIAVAVMKSAHQYKSSAGAAGISTFIVAMTVFLLVVIEILLVLKE